MARHYINSEGQSVKYTPRQQKQRTMRALGLDINSPVDNKTYKSLYDDITRRVRQYNIIQDLDKPISPSDALYDIAYGRLKAGITSTPTLKNLRQEVKANAQSFAPSLVSIYEQRLTANTRRFAEQVRSNPQSYLEQAIKNEEAVFAKFLNTRGVDNDLKAYKDKFYETITRYRDSKTGEYYEDPSKIANPETGLIDTTRYIPEEIERLKSDIEDIHEVRNYLNELARARRNKYRRIKEDATGDEDTGNYRYTLA